MATSRKAAAAAAAAAAATAATAAQVVADAEADPVSSYTVLGNLDHDQAAYTPGATVELTDAEAAPLLALGVVSRPGA